MEQNKIDTKEVEKLFEAGVHLGHKKNRLHPKARKYVYQIINGTAIIDLTKTVAYMNKAKDFLKKLAKADKILLVVATKKVISAYSAKLCQENKIPYISLKWLPGLLTNFDTLMKNVKKMNEMEKAKKDGSWDKYVKHERVKLNKLLNRLKKFYTGIGKLERKPDALLIVDTKLEKNALKEARQNKIPVIAILDTNSNPDMVDHPIVGNDDSPTSAQYLIKELIQSFAKSHK